MHYKDAILIRYKNDNEQTYVRVLSDTEFINEFKRRANDSFWLTIDSIQTTIKSRIGLGKPFIFTFNSPCYKKDTATDQIVQSYDGDIEFDFRQFGMNDYLLMMNSPVAYCLKTCHKIGYYLQKIHDQHLLRMKVEFYQDENGKIWLFSATEIWLRTFNKENKFLLQVQGANALDAVFSGASTVMTPTAQSKILKEGSATKQNVESEIKTTVKKEGKASYKEERDVNKAVDKELGDLVFLHKSQRGKHINIEELRKEVDSIKDQA